MVHLIKRESLEIGLAVRGLKAGYPLDFPHLNNERVNYDKFTDIDLGSTPKGFQISIMTDRLLVKFLVVEEWRAQNAVDSLRGRLISSIDTERVGAVLIEYREQSHNG
jgi:hypothetical protein